ncbi:MAG: hypothetical protein R2780_10680 [Crocinitomicaceae bacterium]|nr:hypothetical protein [Crocinitomicaceae bacterium]
MNFQQALKGFLLAPFQPKKTFYSIGLVAQFDKRSTNLLWAAAALWYTMAVLMRYREADFPFLVLFISITIPFLFQTIGLAMVIRLLSKPIIKHELTNLSARSVVVISYLPAILTQIFGSLYPMYGEYVYYVGLLWIGITAGFGIATLRMVDVKLGLANSLVAVIIIVILTRMFYRVIFPWLF